MRLTSAAAAAQVIQRLGDARVIAIAEFDTAEQAECGGSALMRGGLSSIEVTCGAPLATAAAIKGARRVEGLLVGAGTVLTAAQAELAARAGAHYASSPATNMEVVHACRELELPCFPGVATPSEIERLWALGLRVVGLFPAAAVGGTAFLQAVGTTYPGMRFLPSGGIGLETLRNYLALPTVLAVGCSRIVRREHLRAKSFERVEWLAREARRGSGAASLSALRA
jgi:2-dehydro-3-deoxyphosphogluconate aldolase/(4S)-4-hydroxy-2-oxoglutarate aldolase